MSHTDARKPMKPTRLDAPFARYSSLLTFLSQTMLLRTGSFLCSQLKSFGCDPSSIRNKTSENRFIFSFSATQMFENIATGLVYFMLLFYYFSGLFPQFWAIKRLSKRHDAICYNMIPYRRLYKMGAMALVKMKIYDQIARPYRSKGSKSTTASEKGKSLSKTVSSLCAPRRQHASYCCLVLKNGQRRKQY